MVIPSLRHASIRVALLALCLLLASGLRLPRASAAEPAPFPDAAGLWDAADVALLAQEGVVQGEPGGRFDPSGPLTRAQFAALLTRTLGLAAALPGPAFRDVPAGYWGASVIAAVYEADDMRGVGGGLFQPDRPVTRAEAVTALARALHLPPAPAGSSLADAAAIPPWAAPSVSAAVRAGLVHGFPDGTFRPAATLNRAQAAHLFAEVFVRTHRLPAPGGVYLTTYRDHVDVVWQPSQGALSYEIQRQAPGGAWTPIGTTSDRVFGDYHADPAVSYAYRVVALGFDGLRSDPSEQVDEPRLTPLEQGWVSSDHYSVASKLGLQQAIASGPGASLGLGGLALQGLPAATVQTATPAGPTELFSDDPETATTSEILYQDTVSGHLRLYYDHVNGTGGPAHFVVYLSNPGAQPVTYQYYSWSEAISGGPMAEGEKVAAALIAPPQPIISSSVIQPGAFVELDPYVASVTLPAGGSVQGSYDVAVSGPTQVTFAMVAASLGNPYTAFAQHLLPTAQAGDAGGDGAGRGTFPNADRSFALTFDPQRITSFLLADGRADPYLSGRDATTGQTVQLAGNYGVVYHLSGTPAVDTALVAVPIGGDYLGAVEQNGQVDPAPRGILPSDGSTGFLMAVWPAGQASELDWVPPAGSNLPLQVLAIPLPR
jgi:hypothetical protein